MIELYIFLVLLTLPGILGILRNILINLHLWQIKEYRLDRVLSYLRFEKDLQSVDMTMFIFKAALLFLGSLFLLVPSVRFLSVIFIIIYITFFVQMEWALRDIFFGRLIRPRMKSARNSLIGLGVGMFVGLVYLYLWNVLGIITPDNLDFTTPRSEEYFGFLRPVEPEIVGSIPIYTFLAGVPLLVTLAIDILIPFVTAAMVAITSPLASWSRRNTISKAKILLDSREKPLKVIAVTGSYGKSTTKEMIFQILSGKFNTAKTPANLNTTVGIAKSILNNVKPDTEIFVVEIGAYKRGEILHATQLLKPDIAIVTAITDQHLSLFGSREKLFLAKYELIEGLRDEGVAVLNGDDQNALNMASRTSKKSVFFNSLPIEKLEEGENLGQETDPNRNLYIKEVKDSRAGVELEFVYKSRGFKVKTKLLDAKYGLNLAAAILASLEAGMKMDEIIKKVETLKQPDQLPKITKGINNSLILDDGKTANVTGFMLALDLMKKQEATKKVLITQGIIELGYERKAAYKKIAAEVVKSVDVLVSNDRSLIEMVEKVSKNMSIVYVKSSHDFLSYFRHNISEGDLVLIEGSMPASFIKKVINE